MRLSRDKVNVLARAVSDVLKQMDEVEFIEDPNTIRQETRKILEELLMQEARSTSPPARRSRARSAPSSKARKSGTSSTASITTRKSRSSAFKNPVRRSSGGLSVVPGFSSGGYGTDFSSIVVRFRTDRAGRLSSVTTSLYGPECASSGLPSIASATSTSPGWKLGSTSPSASTD